MARGLLAVALLSALAAPPAAGQTAYAAAQAFGARDRTAAAGVTTRLAPGWTGRAGAGASRSVYAAGGRTVTAEEIDIDVLLLREASGPWGWARLGAGARWMRTGLSAPDPGNRRAARTWDGLVEAGGERRFGGWTVGAAAIHGVAGRDSYLRLDALAPTSDGWRLGAEATGAQGRGYAKAALGLVARRQAGGTGVRLSLGAERRDDGAVGPYLTLTLDRARAHAAPPSQR